MYHLEHILYILAIALGPLSVMIWVIVGAPKIAKPKTWTIHPDADKLLELDEHEQSIS